MKKTYIIPNTLVIDVEEENIIAESPTPTGLNGYEKGDGLANEDRGSSIWDNEW